MKEDHAIHISLCCTYYLCKCKRPFEQQETYIPVYRYVWLIGSPRICGRRFSFGRALFQGTC